MSKQTPKKAIVSTRMEHEINVKEALNEALGHIFGCDLTSATEKQLYRALCTVVRGLLAEKNRIFNKDCTEKGRKEVYYMSMEFLVGTSLRNNLFNLGVEDEARKVLKDAGFDIEALYEMEPDAGLGNGGLGRLAS